MNETIEDIKASAADAMDSAKEATNGNVDSISKAANDAYEATTDKASSFTDAASEAMESATDQTSEMTENAKDALDSAAETVSDAMTTASDNMSTTTESLMDKAKKATTDASDAIKNATETGSSTTTAELLMDKAKESMSAVSESVRDTVKSVTDSSSSSTSAGGNAVTNAIDGVMEKASKAIESISTTPPPGESKTKSILYWRNPIKTGVVFTFGLVFFCLMLFSKVTVLRFISGCLLFYFSLAFIVVNGSKLFVGFFGDNFVKKPTSGVEYLNQDVLMKKIPEFCDRGNAAIDKAKKALYCVDNKQTITLIGALFGVYLVSKIIPTMVLAFLIFLIAFSAPRIYEWKQEEIDDLIKKLKEEYVVMKDKLTKLFKKKVDEGAKFASEQSAQLTQTIKEKSGPVLDKMKKSMNLPAMSPAKKTE